MSRFTKVVVIDPATHPGFVRMREKEGFTEFGEAEVDAMVKAPGLKFVVFADDPNKQKETLDIVVIAPEVKKTLPQVAVALFRGEAFLGAVEGLSDWGAYEAGLAEIASRTAPQKRTIAVLTKQAED